MMKWTKTLMYFYSITEKGIFHQYHSIILVKNQSYGMILMKYSLIIDEIKTHQCFCPSHDTKCHFFGVFRIKNIMFDDVLVPWALLKQRTLCVLGSVDDVHEFSVDQQINKDRILI